MNYGLIILLTLFIGLSSATSQVRLKWKVEENKPIYYNAVLDIAATTAFEIQDSDIPEKVVSVEAVQQYLDLFGQKPCYVSLVHKSDNIVDVKISQRLEDSGMDSETIQAIKDELGLEENVLLRGSVFSDGGIYSYFIENQQKSILSAGFELPTKLISKGDEWEIDFSSIDMKGVIITDTVSRSITVRAQDIKIENGDTLVTISYNLSEYMKGRGKYAKESYKELGLEVKFIGLGNFSISQGKWLEYDAVFTLESLGIMTGKMKGIFSLRPVNDIPSQYKE